MASAPDAAQPPRRVVEVKHGKRKVDILVEGAATVAWLMSEIETETGVMRKHQKLLCKGKPLVAAETVDAQCVFKNGKATVMLLASAGGSGAPPPQGSRRSPRAVRRNSTRWPRRARRVRRRRPPTAVVRLWKSPWRRASPRGDPPGSWACARSD